jgi:hypothetical protein
MVVLAFDSKTLAHTVRFIRGQSESAEVTQRMRAAGMFPALVLMLHPYMRSVLAKEVPVWQGRGMGAKSTVFVDQNMNVKELCDGQHVLRGRLVVATTVL